MICESRFISIIQEIMKENTMIVFDLDDTLYQQVDQFNNAINRLLDDINVEGFEMYKHFKHYSEEVYDDWVNGITTLEEMRNLRIQLTLKDFGYNISDDQASLMQEYYLEEQQRITLSQEMMELLDRLVQDEVKIGIISNGESKHQRMKIDALNLCKWFKEEDILVSKDINVEKPDSKIFNHFSDNREEMSNYIYIGDNYVNDIIGAHQVGWKTVWFNYNDIQKETKQNTHDYRVKNYNELSSLIFNDILK